MTMYFKFSSDQLIREMNMSAKLNRHYVPTYVIYKGRKVQYTEMNSLESSRYSDSKIVAEFDDLTNVVYGEI